MPFFNNEVKRRVWKVLNDRIEHAQAEYDNEVKAIEQEVEEEIATIKEVAKTRKDSALDSCVEGIIG